MSNGPPDNQGDEDYCKDTKEARHAWKITDSVGDVINLVCSSQEHPDKEDERVKISKNTSYYEPGREDVTTVVVGDANIEHRGREDNEEYDKTDEENCLYYTPTLGANF